LDSGIEDVFLSKGSENVKNWQFFQKLWKNRSEGREDWKKKGIEVRKYPLREPNVEDCSYGCAKFLALSTHLTFS